MTSHSLIIPTRNRPDFIFNAVAYYLRNSSSNHKIECIVCDGSDDPENIASSLAEFDGDPRLVLIDNSVKSTGVVSSMKANWSRAINAANGEWLTVIGDDDLLDPAVIDLISYVERDLPTVSAISWEMVQFDHGVPPQRASRTPLRVPFKNECRLINTRQSLANALNWTSKLKPPPIICGIYHGAVRRDALDAVKNARPDRVSIFDNDMVDYDFGWTLCDLLDRALFTTRPWSVNGHSYKSNSFAIGDHQFRERRFQQWMREAKEVIGWPEGEMLKFINEGVDPAFFFTIPMCLFGFTNHVRLKKGLAALKLTEENVVHVFVNACKSQLNFESFTWFKENLIKLYAIVSGQTITFSQGYVDIWKDQYIGAFGDHIWIDRAEVDYDITNAANLSFMLVAKPQHILANLKLQS